ncbi:MAG: rhodanese-like domain-containing protein [Syntrophales bacterium]
MKKVIITIAVFALAFGMALPSFSADSAASLIIDVRTEVEWNNGHLEGAVLIPYDRIGEKIGTAVKDKNTRIYLYCRTGRRTKIAQEALEKLGYKNSVNLQTLENAAKTLKRKIVK